MCNAHKDYNFYMEFGKNFRLLRKESGYTQKEVAEKLGISQSNVSDWEKNVARPEYENLIGLAEIYNVTLEELLGLPNTFPHNDHCVAPL